MFKFVILLKNVAIVDEKIEMNCAFRCRNLCDTINVL